MPEAEPMITAHEVGISQEEAYHFLEQEGRGKERFFRGKMHVGESPLEEELFNPEMIVLMAELSERGIPSLNIKGQAFYVLHQGCFTLQNGHTNAMLADNPVDAARVLNEYIARRYSAAQ